MPLQDPPELGKYQLHPTSREILIRHGIKVRSFTQFPCYLNASDLLEYNTRNLEEPPSETNLQLCQLSLIRPVYHMLEEDTIYGPPAAGTMTRSMS